MTRNDAIANKNNLLKLEDMIKKYNKKPEKNIKKKDIARILKNTEVIVPVSVEYDNLSSSNELLYGTIFKPDIVKNSHRARLIPIFTSHNQIPNYYMEQYSLIRMSVSDIYGYMNSCEDIQGIVINPFTDLNIEFRKKVDDRSDRHSSNEVYDNNGLYLIYKNERYFVDKFPFTIGREDTDIEIPKGYISKTHVVISYKDGKYRIADYESTNGTKINGRSIKSKVYYELKDRYQIELSEKEIIYVVIK